MKDKKIKEKWEKEWDRIFKSLLDKELAYSHSNRSVTMNDYAKEFINKLVENKTSELFKRHNLYAISYERIVGVKQRNERVIKLVKERIEEMDKCKKDFKSLL